MSFRDALLPAIDSIRGIPDRLFGIRLWRVWLRVVAWDGPAVGIGAQTVTETEIAHSDGSRPKVREMRSRDIVASGGVLEAATYEVGPLTPTDAMLELMSPAAGAGREVMFRVTGPGLPSAGALCKRVEGDEMRPFTGLLRLQRLGR